MRPAPRAALLFDIDGTLADTDHLHLMAFNEVFGPRGHHFDRKRFNAVLQGHANTAIAARFLPDETLQRQHEIMAQKEIAFRRLAQAGLHPMPGLLDLLDRADTAGLPYAAVTNAPPANAELILSAIGIRHRFRIVVFGDELAHGKPHPLPYLEALRRLDADKDLAVAFEDSPSGMRSASGAGIATIGMLTGQAATALRDVGAVMVAADYTDQDLLDFVERRVSAVR